MIINASSPIKCGDTRVQHSVEPVFEPIKSKWEFRDPSQKHPSAEDPESTIEDKPDDDSTEPENLIICRQCRHIVAKPDDRIEVQGSHQHTFANPQGLVFEIGCFRFAQGCGFVGPLTDEFTWFKGYAWRVAVCGACLTHLGWLYLSPGSDSFCGLIMDRLIQSQ